MSTPSRKFYKSLGRPPWSDDAVLRALEEHKIRRILPRDQQAIAMNCSLGDVPLGIMGKIREAGIVFDKGNGEKLC